MLQEVESTGKWKVYKDPLMDGSILMGYKSAAYMDAGYFYTPTSFCLPVLSSCDSALKAGDPFSLFDRKYRSLDE
jgi:hypothetical protein